MLRQINVFIILIINLSACWLWLGCWSNNVANNHPSPGPFDCRVLRSCLVPQCSYPPHWHYQRRLANCNWMPASCTSTSWQPSTPRRHPTCWASSQGSHTISRMPCHGAWTPAPLSAHPSIGCSCTAPQIETPNCTCRTIISFSDNNIRAAQWADYQWNAEWADNPTRLSTLIPDTDTHTPGMVLLRRAWARLNRLRTVSDVSSPACTNVIWPSLRPVSVAQNKPSTMSSSTVQSIDPLHSRI